jgi:hypothetical protein
MEPPPKRPRTETVDDENSTKQTAQMASSISNDATKETSWMKGVAPVKAE